MPPEKNAPFRLPDALGWDPGPFSQDCVQVFAGRTGLRQEEGSPWLFLRQEALPEEHYRLTVEADRVTLAAATEKGVIQGLTELFLRLKDGETAFVNKISEAAGNGSGKGIPREYEQKLFGDKKMIEINFKLDQEGWESLQ